MHLWSKLSGAQWADAWEERFANNRNFVMAYIKGGKSVRLQVYCETEEDAQAIKDVFGGSIRAVKDAEWQTPPALPKPLKIRDRFLVTAESETGKLAKLQQEYPDRDLISIPPEMAFGTGDHATTSTCMRFLVDVGRERKGTDWSMVDLGAGSGLLAIAGSKLGAKDIWGCDFDPFAVAVSLRNVQRNKTPNVTLVEKDVFKWKPRKGGYDVVAANLFSTVFLEAWPVIAKALAKDGDLIISGILATQAWEVFEAAAKCGLGFPKIITKGKWVSARGGFFDDLEKKKI